MSLDFDRFSGRAARFIEDIRPIIPRPDPEPATWDKEAHDKYIDEIWPI